MGIFNIFKKQIPEVEEIESGKIGIADQIIDYALVLIKDKENIKEQLKEINKIRKLSIEKREAAYLPVYLGLEKAILVKKPTLTKEYFSRKILRKQKGLTQEDLRRTIREKFEVNKLHDNFRVLFLAEPQRNLILYELMLQKFISLIPKKTMKEIPDLISKEISKNILKSIKINKEKLDFSALNKKIDENPIIVGKIIIPFKSLFFSLYDELAKINGNEFVDKLLIYVYNFVETYGFPHTSDALQVLPKAPSKEATTAAAYNVVDYAANLTLRKDLILPQMERITDAEMLVAEQKEKIYFDVYLELEKFITEHMPPAVKKSFTSEELREEIRQNINIQNLEHRFKLLFLEEKEQIIELFIVFYEYYFKQALSFWNINELQKFVSEKAKGTLLDGTVIEKEKIDFSTAETKISNLPKNKLNSTIHDLSRFLLIFYKKTNEIIGQEKGQKAISYAYQQIKEQYSQLPAFNDFIRTLPEGVLDYEKRVSLSPRAAEEVITYLVEILKKEKIEEHLKSLEEARKLPLEKQSEAFFNIYLKLQHYIIDHRPSIKRKEITLSDLKEKIRKHVNVKDLEDKFQLLFLTQNEVLVKLVGDLIKECAANFIDKQALVDTVKEFTKKNCFLKDVDEEGLIDFETFFVELKRVKGDKVKILNSILSKLISAVYEKAKEILGEIQAKKLFGISYTNLQKKYGANLLQVLKVIPKGVLEAEKFELLGKEEVEKTAKELVKIDTLKGEFMNIAAHELKTPLVPIISYLEMLLNDKRITSDQREKLEICLSSAKREADLVNDILDISKLEAGSMKFEFETIDIVELVKEAISGLDVVVKQKKLEFKIDIPSKLPLVKGDRRRLIQVISNLVNNATKFTEKGGITVSAEKREQDILIGVADTGMGITKETASKLFTKFFQADTTARRKQGGTGLGLAICKGIVQGHKGKIWVESEGYVQVSYT